MRHLSLNRIFLACLIVCLSCQKSGPKTDYASNEKDPVSVAIGENNWEEVEKLTRSSKEPLKLLVLHRALFEQKKFENLLQNPPLDDETLSAYDSFLRILSAFELSHFKEVSEMPIPSNLPRPLQERLSFIRGESFQEMEELEKAREIYETFSKEFKRSSFRGEVLTRLADIYRILGHEDRSIKAYEDLYEFFPLSDSEDIARQKLLDAGRFWQIDTDAHLTRIQQLRKASSYSRAAREIKALLANASASQKPRLELALAQIKFGERNYRECEKLARRALKTKSLGDLEIEWRQLLATSHIRLDQFELGEKEFLTLLEKKIPAFTRERILYRLGLSAFDHLHYQLALDYFNKVRDLRGSYIESAHWFAALTIYFLERSKPEGPDPEHLKKAVSLLEKLIGLPQGQNFAPQALYWKSIFSELLNQPESLKEARLELQNDWPLSFHSRFLNREPFDFVSQKAVVRTGPTSPTKESQFLTSLGTDISWRRLELFRSVNLKTWASLELDKFLENNQSNSDGLNLAVAERLESVEDWANLVRWADKNMSRSLKNLDLQDPVVRFHYPKAFEADVLKNAERFGLSPFLIWGVIREESRFRADVISSAGAYGLMQVMPSLGRRIGRDLGETSAKRAQLTDPSRNIRYGSFHLAELKEQIGRLQVSASLKTILQVAAYNAGIEAVTKWLKDKESSRPDLFVESIPFQETRQYVKRVLQSAYIYFRLYGDAEVVATHAPSPTKGTEPQPMENL
jgi:soluble lytic murein transglycosylase